MTASVDRAALHRFVTGSAVLGEYPSTLYAQVESWRQALLAECRDRKVTVHLTGVTDPASHVRPGTLLADVAAQTGERWPDPTRTDSRTWTLGQSLEQVRLCCLALDAADAGGTSSGGGTVPPGQPQGVTEWAAELAAADLWSGKTGSVFNATPWNTEQGGATSKPAWPPPVVDAPGGGKALRFTLPSKGKRIEVEPNHRTFDGKSAAWFGFQLHLADGFPLASDDWRVVWQLHGNDTDSPRFALQVRAGQLRIGDSKPLAPLATGRWYQVVVYADLPNGRMSVWLDGAPVADAVTVGKSPVPYYLKCGFYESSALPGGTLYQRGHRLGSGYGAVLA